MDIDFETGSEPAMNLDDERAAEVSSERRLHRDAEVLAMTTGKVCAVYHSLDFEPPEYRENPLILAIPPIMNRFRLAENMRAMLEIPHSDEYRSWPMEMKLMGISRIARNGIALTVQPKITEWVHVNMRAHLHALYQESTGRAVQDRYARIQNGDFQMLDPFNPVHSSALLLLGISGVGKTTNAMLSLSSFPRVILHEEFNGKPFRHAQLVWIHCVCPHNGSVGALCREILAIVDEQLGTYYLKEMRTKANSADYVAKVGRVLRAHSTGLLIIDEIQNCLRATDEKEMLDLLVNLLNANPCPVLAMGTPETTQLVSKKFRLARRFASRAIIMEPFKTGRSGVRANDRDGYLKSLCRLDFLPEQFTDREGIEAALMKVSAGVPAFITLAWMLTQQAGVIANRPRVTPELVFGAVKEPFSRVKGLLHALETRNLNTLSNIADMAIEEVRERIEALASENTLTNESEQWRQSELFYRAESALLSFGYSRPESQRAISKARENEVGLGLPEIVRRALGYLNASLATQALSDVATHIRTATAVSSPPQPAVEEASKTASQQPRPKRPPIPGVTTFKTRGRIGNETQKDSVGGDKIDDSPDVKQKVDFSESSSLETQG